MAKVQNLNPLKAKNPVASIKTIKISPKLNINAVKIRKQKGL